MINDNNFNILSIKDINKKYKLIWLMFSEKGFIRTIQFFGCLDEGIYEPWVGWIHRPGM